VLTPDHRATEELIRASGVPFTFLRNNLYTESQLPLLLQAAERNEVTASWNTGTIASASRIDYADGAAAVIIAGRPRNAVLEFSGDTAWSGDDFAAAASRLLGKPVMFERRTADEARIELDIRGVPPEERDFRVALDENIRAGAFGHVSGTLAGLIGRPTTPLLEGLRAVLPTTSAAPGLTGG
jgi:NAD(P)H dehydrogenase (quinone)